MKKCFVVFLFGVAVSSVCAQTLLGRPRRPFAARSDRMMPAKSAVEVNADAVLDGLANLSQFATNEAVSVVLPVWNVPVDKVREVIAALKSPNGKVCVLGDVNALLVEDVPAKVTEMRDCIRRMDVREPMMQIEWIRIKNICPSEIRGRVEEVLRGLSPTSFVIADDRTGRLFLFSSSPGLAHDLIVRLEDCAKRKVSAYYLPWSNSSNVAARLNIRRPQGLRPSGLLSRQMPRNSGVSVVTNSVKTVPAVALSEAGPLIVCGTKSQKEKFDNEIARAESEARPRREYEVVHTVLKVEDVKTTDEALARALNLEGKFEAIRSQFFTFRDGESGKDVGEVASDGGCFQYALTVGREAKKGELLWSLTCSNKCDAVCQKSGTLGAEGMVVTIGSAMVDDKTAYLFRMSVQSRPLQLSVSDEPPVEARANVQPFGRLRRPGTPEYVVSRDFVSVGKGDGTSAISASGGIRELCITNLYAGKPVTCIGDFAFAGCTGLRKVIVPEGVTEIGMSAFLGCSDLQSVVLPATGTNIGEYAFATTESLRTPDIVCAQGDKERMRKLIKSVLVRDQPCPGWGVWQHPDAKKAAMQRQSEVIDEALSRIREISEPEPPPVAKPEVKQDVPRQGLVGSLRERRMARLRQREAEMAQAEQEKAQREAERAEQRAQLLAIQEELKRVRAARQAAEMTTDK
mgnify:CR=1 FL=1